VVAALQSSPSRQDDGFRSFLPTTGSRWRSAGNPSFLGLRSRPFPSLPLFTQFSEPPETVGSQILGELLMGKIIDESEVEFYPDASVQWSASSKRRSSSRLRDIPEQKRPFYGDKLVSGSGEEVDGEQRLDGTPNADKDAEDIDVPDIVDLEDSCSFKMVGYDSFVTDSLKQTMKKSNGDYLDFVQKQTKPNKGSDVKATNEILNKKENVNSNMKLGLLPGIVAGHRFFSRAEMVAIGFQQHWLSGIDYLRKHSKRLMQNDHIPHLAVAVVLAHPSKGDIDCINEVVFTHPSGNKLPSNRHRVENQAMPDARLALKNNMEQCIPVRFIYAHKCSDTNGSKEYTYCGLYKVLKCWSVEGKHGQPVFTYRLKKLLGQPKVSSDLVCSCQSALTGVSVYFSSLVCEDISYGEEAVKIPVTNTVDSCPIGPPDFKYTKSIQVATDVVIPPSAPGCNCKGNCTNPKTCSCAQLNGSDLPYSELDGGRLIKAKDVVYECGPGCSCGSKCINRVSQHGLKFQLEVYRTKVKGWAVRSWDLIPAGAPVCEYTGLLRRNAEMDSVHDNDYIFDIDCLHTMHGIDGREKREGDVPVTSGTPEQVDATLRESDTEFCIDAGSCGNVTRFINHSCEPNLFVQCILSSHHDLRLARIVLFAADDIDPMTELTYDYAYRLGSVTDEDGNVKELECHCGTSECRGRLY
ncbi:unnamed protein product, partial [Linum tenue]